MLLNLKTVTASYNSTTLTWELQKEAQRISLSLNLRAVVRKMVRNRMINERIRKIQVVKSIAVWNTANQSVSLTSIHRTSAERNAIARLERLKY
jgi:hypothetical protein